jgi:arylsulfatase A-like enzyme
LNDRCVTIAQALKPAGYATCCVGKWHVAKDLKPKGPTHNWPLQRGFDQYYGILMGAANFYDPGSLTRGNTWITVENDPEYKPQHYYFTEAITDNACRFISDHAKQQPNKPFFAYVAYTAAHWPMQAPEEDIAKYKGKYDTGYEPVRKSRFEKLKHLRLIDPNWEMTPQAADWDKVEDKAWEARCMEVYAAMIDRMDQGVGKIVDTLRQNGQFDNTLILFLQDNGACAETVGRVKTPPGSKRAKEEAQPLRKKRLDELTLSINPPQTRDGRRVRMGPGVMPGPADTYIAYGQGWANVSNTPFREYKHWVHEGGISTPLIAHWPGHVARRGGLERQSGHLIDLMATCVDVAGAQYPKALNGKQITPMEGRSLVPALAGKPIDREAIYWEHEGNRAVLMGNWKLVAKGPDGAWELYDMDADRTEMHDLSKREPAQLKKMVAMWEAYARRTNVLPWPWTPPYGATQ